MVHEKTLVENSPLTGLDVENRNLINRLAVLEHQLQFKTDRHMVNVMQLKSENEALKVKRLFRSLGHNIRNKRTVHQTKKRDMMMEFFRFLQRWEDKEGRPVRAERKKTRTLSPKQRRKPEGVQEKPADSRRLLISKWDPRLRQFAQK